MGGGVAGVELKHHRRGVGGGVGGGEGREAQDLLQEVVGGSFGRVIRHDDSAELGKRVVIGEIEEKTILFGVWLWFFRVFRNAS